MQIRRTDQQVQPEGLESEQNRRWTVLKQYKLQAWSSVLVNFLILLLMFIGDGLALHQTHFLFFLGTQLDCIFQSYLHFSTAVWLRSSPWNVNRSGASHFQAQLIKTSQMPSPCSAPPTRLKHTSTVTSEVKTEMVKPQAGRSLSLWINTN